MSLFDRLAARRLIVVTGKGGVGKSAMTAALGHGLAARGRRTLVLEVDPRENLHQLLDVPPSGGDAVEVAPNLLLQNLKPRQVVDWVVRKQVKIEMLVKRVQQSPIYHRFVEGAPGLKEMAILGHALRLVRGETPGVDAVDTVILDAPATGHGIYLLTASGLFSEAIGEGPFADMAREVAEFTADADATGVVLVTLAEEMPVQEAIELRQALEEKLDRQPELLVVNGVYPALPAAKVADAANDATDGAPEELLDLWRHRRAVNERELARLERRWSGPRVELPLLPVDRGPALVADLGGLLDEALAALDAEEGGR
ncbi:MAG: ArsA family ATPase [Acidobacteriota bacterium]